MFFTAVQDERGPRKCLLKSKRSMPLDGDSGECTSGDIRHLTVRRRQESPMESTSLVSSVQPVTLKSTTARSQLLVRQENSAFAGVIPFRG